METGRETQVRALVVKANSKQRYSAILVGASYGTHQRPTSALCSTLSI
jgi:hypothetical protein